MSQVVEQALKMVECKVSADLGAWLAGVEGSVGISTYQAGKVVLVGWTGEQVFVTMRDFPKAMGLAASGERLAVATHEDLVVLANAKGLSGTFVETNHHDALYVPRISYHTGDLALHDLAFGNEGLWAVNTRFSCLATLSDTFNFIPRWKPPFISALLPEDRCHLNGMAMVDGAPRFVTALGATDRARGWVSTKATGGILMDMTSDRIIRNDLCMPHSPRWREGKLWVLNSGLGELWTIEPGSGRHEVVAQLPGYLRGLDFVGHFALIGMSKVRSTHLFEGLPVSERCKELLCGMAVVDTRNGKCMGMLEFTKTAEELYDVVFLPGVRRPAILNHKQAASRQAVCIPGSSMWIRPAAEQGVGNDGARQVPAEQGATERVGR